jgi:hypothetical protein
MFVEEGSMQHKWWSLLRSAALSAGIATVALGHGLCAAQFQALSADRIAGRDAASGITFSAVQPKPGIASVEIRLPSGRSIVAEIDYNTKSTQIRSVISHSRRLAALSIQDVEQLKTFAKSIDGLPHQTGDALGSVAAYLSKAPVNVVLDISFDGRVNSGLSASLCNVFNPHVVRFNSRAHFTYKKHTHNPWSSIDCYKEANGCTGRCGVGCDTDLSINGHNVRERQRLTQACLNHDRCVEHQYAKTGKFNVFGECMDEFFAAAPDYVHGVDCASMTGSWSAGVDGLTTQFLFDHPWRLVQHNDFSVTGTANFPTLDLAQACTGYAVIGEHSYNVFLGTASRPFPPDGCPSSLSFAMLLNSENQGGGINSCNFASQGSRDLGRKPSP